MQDGSELSQEMEKSVSAIHSRLMMQFMLDSSYLLTALCMKIASQLQECKSMDDVSNVITSLRKTSETDKEIHGTDRG